MQQLVSLDHLDRLHLGKWTSVVALIFLFLTPLGGDIFAQVDGSYNVGMPRRTRGPGVLVQTTKNYYANLATTADATNNNVLFASATTGGGDNETGYPTTIKKVWVEISISGATANAAINWIIYKLDATDANLNPTTFATAGAKQKVFASGATLVPGGGFAFPYVIKMWVKIPRRHQMMSEGDRLYLTTRGTGTVITTHAWFVYRYT